MGDGKRDRGGSDDRASDEAAFSARLRSLGTRLGKADQTGRVETRSGGASGSESSGMARGFRLSSELVGGVIAGALIGYLLDWGLGISPWGMIVFVLLGFAAGVLNVMREAGLVRQPTGRALDRRESDKN